MQGKYYPWKVHIKKFTKLQGMTVQNVQLHWCSECEMYAHTWAIDACKINATVSCLRLHSWSKSFWKQFNVLTGEKFRSCRKMFQVELEINSSF